MPFNVQMPDGTVIRDVPDGTTKAQIMARLKGAKVAAPGGIMSTIKGATDTALHGFTAGVMDPVAAGLAAPIQYGIDRLRGQNVSLGDEYRRSLASSRAPRNAFAAQHPVASTAIDVAGGIASPINKVAKLIPGANVAARVARTVIPATVYGGIQGTADTGTVRGGLENAALSAGTAGAFGLGGKALSRALRGAKVPDAVRLLANEGVVLTPRQRGGPIRTAIDTALKTLPGIKSIPKAAEDRGIEQLNVAAYNRVLAPIGARMPMSTAPGHQAIAALGDKVYSTFDDAAGTLNLSPDRPLTNLIGTIGANAPRSVGRESGQLRSIVGDVAVRLNNGLSGEGVSGLLGDLRGLATSAQRSPMFNERNIGDELWKLHNGIEDALTRQNGGPSLDAFQKARESVTLLKRVEDAAARPGSKDGVFSPNGLFSAVSKRGYGTTTARLARGEARMQDLASAAKQILPDRVPNSGTPERAFAASLLLGGPAALAHFASPLAAIPAASMAGYMPGVDRILQNFALKRPDLLVRGGRAIDQSLPRLGTGGSIAARDLRR